MNNRFFLVSLIALLLVATASFADVTEIIIDYGPAPSLSVDIVNPPASATAGQSLTLASSVTNVGTVTATNVWLAWTLPAGWTLTSGSSNVTFASLGQNAVGWNNITVTTGSSGGTLTASSASSEGVSGSDSATVTIGTTTTTSPPTSPPPSGPISPPVTQNPPPSGPVITIPVMTYSIAGETIWFINKPANITVTINNPSQATLHNVGIDLAGLPPGSYQIITSPLAQLLSYQSASFTVLVNTSSIAPAIYNIEWLLKSDEVQHSTTSAYELQGLTEGQAQVQEAQKQQQEAGPILAWFQFIFIFIIIGVTFTAIFMLFLHFRNRCAFCGGHLEKVYSGQTFDEYKCTKCDKRYQKTKSR